MASDSQPINFFEAPKAPPEVISRGAKCFCTAISVHSNTCKLEQRIYKEVISSSQKL